MQTLLTFGWKQKLIKTDADVLIARIARQNWKLLALNFSSSIIGALLEGVTLGVIFLAVALLTNAGEINWHRYILVSSIPVLGDWLNDMGKVSVFLCLLLLAVIAQVFLSVCDYLNKVSIGYLAAKLRVQVVDQVHRQILRFSFACASRYKVGDLVNYVAASDGAVKVQLEQLNSLIVSNCLLLAYVIVMVVISPWLLLAALVMTSILYSIQRHLLPHIRSTASANEIQQVETFNQVTENIQGLRLLHTYGQQQVANETVEQFLQQLQPGLRRQVRQLSLLGPISQSLPIMMLALLTATAFLLFQSRSTGVLPSLATFVLALQRFSIRLQGVLAARNSLASNSGRMHRLREILDSQDKEFARCEGLVFPGLQTDIELHQLSLRYQSDQPMVLCNLNLVIPRGKVTALVGQSGAGKSSLVDLLVGLYEPTIGSIQVNGQDLREYNPISWRQYLGVVSQDTFVFNVSILENIRFGQQTASDDEVISAAQAAQAHDFIDALPEGYGTIVGERGYRLSGGQRQRLALARAILRNPELLILDEATSALDTQSERLVQQALQEFGRDRTVVVIAHRLSTIVGADQIVVMKHGQIVEQGSHAELLKLGGAYADYWELQSQGELLVQC